MASRQVFLLIQQIHQIPKNNALIISGVGLGGGLDPNYITLANDVITMHKQVSATSLSIGSGGGIMCCGNITATLGGVSYASIGLEATTINCTGLATIDALTVHQHTSCAGTLIIHSLEAMSFDGSNHCVLHRP